MLTSMEPDERLCVRRPPMLTLVDGKEPPSGPQARTSTWGQAVLASTPEETWASMSIEDRRYPCGIKHVWARATSIVAGSAGSMKAASPDGRIITGGTLAGVIAGGIGCR